VGGDVWWGVFGYVFVFFGEAFGGCAGGHYYYDDDYKSLFLIRWFVYECVTWGCVGQRE
jgi:hypothetical protein